MKNIFILTIVAAGCLTPAIPASAQKTPTDEVGFNPQKLYDVNDIDSVNLFNGNLTVTLPIGRRYQVSSALSYQLMLVYNGKIYDIETFECEDGDGNPMICVDDVPTRQSNAGVSWRVSLGRLLAPHDVTANRSSFDRDDYIYEGPAGDEHTFPSANDDAPVMLSNDPQPLRLIKVANAGVPTREVEFPTGEIHRFQQVALTNDEYYGVWHLVSIRDRFSNQVTIAPMYTNVGGHLRETGWSISDTVGRSHQVNFVYHSALSETWNRGMSVSSIKLDGLDGVDTTYTFTYTTCSWMPMLQSVTLPDATSYTFTYETTCPLDKVMLPTGGSVAYTYQSYAFASEDVCANSRTGTDNILTQGIKSRTISDGVSTRTWEYVQRRGPEVTVDYDNLPCYNWDGSHADEHGPFYWVRTSVLAPVDTAGERVRSDHYFNIFFEPPYPDIGEHPLAGVYRSAFGYPGVAGRPPDGRAKGSLDVIADDVIDYPADVSGSDGTNERSLASRVYGGCSSAGDCTAGQLLRSTYVSHDCLGAGVIYNPDRCWVVSTRTVMEDDLGCGAACYTQETINGRTGGGFHTGTTTKSNFPSPGTTCTSASPCAETVTGSTYTAYAPWPSADRLNDAKAWVTGTYTEQQRTEGTVTSKGEYKFSETTGALEAVRILKGASRGQEDLLTIFGSDAGGNVTQEKSFGGDEASLSTTDCCSLPGSGLDYLIRRTYDASNFLTNVQYLDPDSCTDISQSGCTSILTTMDRTVDKWTGLATDARDPAGVETTYAYDDNGRLETVGPTISGTAPSRTYAYTAATSSSNARATESLLSASGASLGTSTFEFDGLGRVRRTSTPLPGGKLASVQTDYDAHGRKRRVSQPVERTTHPTSSIGSTWTTFGYDALGRQVSVTAPDGAMTTFSYTGARTATRSSKVATSTSSSSSQWTNATTTEHYDALGRLRRVEEAAGDTSVTNTTGSPTWTDYTYDAGGRLTSVTDGTSLQQRNFAYDGRGFLTSETHPENDTTTYQKYDARGHALQRTSGGKTLKFSYDAAERLTKVADITGTEKTLKMFDFAAANDGSNLRAGKLEFAIRYNDLPSAGKVEVKETYTYDTLTGQMSNRTTLVERVVGTARTTMQQFSYGLTYDDFLLPEDVSLPTCSANGCSTANGLGSVTYGRSAGYLTSVDTFADLTYHPSGMVKTVVHESSPSATDTYSATSGTARPSEITFSGGSPACPAITPSTIAAASSVCAGSTGNTASLTPRSGITHTWTISGGTITSGTSGDSVTFTAPSSGVVALSVTAADACNETATSSKSIEVSSDPVAPVITGPAAVCGGTSGYSASVPSQPGIAWSITGGTITSSTTSASITFTAGASGTVTLTATLTDVCNETASSSKNIPITPTPTATLSGPGTVVKGSSVYINVALTGASPWRVEWSDGYLQPSVTSPNISRSVTPDETLTYDVVVSSGECEGASNGPLLVTVIPPPPAVVTATTQQNREVLVTWSAVAGASGYRIERTTRKDAAPSFVTTVSGVTSFNDMVPASALPVTYVYYVRTLDSVGEVSDRGPWDHATGATILYAQPQISASVTTVNGTDMTELRNAVDALRYAVYLTPAFGGSSTASGPITAAHFTAVVMALSQARVQTGTSAFTYSGVPVPAPGGTVLAAHITQLREALR